MSTNVLIIGSGGREHALAWKLAQSPRIGKLYVAPGNGGTREIAENIPIEATDVDRLVWFAEQYDISLTVVGPDDSLARGIVDAFQASGLEIFGPTRAAAEIESAKAFAKMLMHGIGVPTAAYRVFRHYDEALVHVRAHGAPIVVKASGLALGKGVYVCTSLVAAEEALQKIMIDHVHKNAWDEVVVEDYLEGEEISIHAFCDGNSFLLFPPAQDHKPIRDGDQGENTGGMGTITPVPWVTAATLERIESTIIGPILQALVGCGRRFRGLLYPGLIITAQGPMVLEFNARFGDPEMQSYARLLRTDLLDILQACARGKLIECAVEWRPGYAVCVTVASGGYPGTYKTGFPIQGVKEAERIPGVVIFHAGTTFVDSELRTSGGRVLGVSAFGETLREAIDRSHEAVRLIHFEGMQYRKDIGAKALAHRS